MDNSCIGPPKEPEGDVVRAVFSLLQQRIHQWAKSKGWWDDPNRSFGEQMANFHAELSEAWEEFREHGLDPESFIYHGDDGKPEGLAVELADCLIRIFDTCGRYDFPLAEALVTKLEYNKNRPYRHGNKKA